MLENILSTVLLVSNETFIIINACLLLNLFGNIKPKLKNFQCAIILIIIALFTIIWYNAFDNNPLMFTLIHYATIIIAPTIIFKKFKSFIMYPVFLLLSLDSLLGSMFRYFFMSFLNTLTDPKQAIFKFFISCVGQLLLMFVLTRMLKQKIFRFADKSVLVISKMTYVLIVISVFLMGGIIEFLLSVPESSTTKAIKIMVIILIFIILIIITELIINNVRKNYLENISILLNRQIESQVSYYDDINKINSEMRSFRHDYKNHMLCIKAMLKANAVDDAIGYIRDLSDISATEKSTYDSGNIIADSLFNDKKKKAEKYNTKILFKGIIPTVGIPPVDLCTILSNALDNAIEACAKESENKDKIITITSDFKQGYAFINITNPIFERVNIQSNTIRTSKENATYHGFGLRNIEKTVKKYNGTFNICCKDNVFELDINLKINTV